MRLFRPWSLLKYLYPEAIFRVKTREKVLYLTFDDGPDPGSTPRIMAILNKTGINAIFFCNGLNAEGHPGLITDLISAGHIVGNHGYLHLDGWRTSTEEYIENVEKAGLFTSAGVFRPPFGRLTLRQYKRLKNKYSIFFWDIMPYDFDRSFGPANSLRILKRLIRPGSVIVLHDNATSFDDRMLESFISFATSSGYNFGNPRSILKF